MEGQKQNRKNWQFIGLMFALGVFAGLFRIAKAQTCTPFWSCTVWSTCSNGTQARTCQDLNYCGLTRHPIELQDCATGPEIVPDVNPNEEQPILPPEPAATPSGCLPIWSCTVWSACEGNQQIRTCRDAQNCGVSASQPAEVIACSSAPSGCTPSWSCAAWTLCVNGMQERGCTDVHSCSTESVRPPQSRSCTIPTPTPTPSPTTPGNPPTSEPAPGNCVSDWTCSIWSTCLSGSQTSTCTDANSCGTTSGKPTEQQSCSSGAVCSPAWACTAWSTCSNGAQTRTCTDANSCGITTGRPVQQQNCSADVSPSPTPTLEGFAGQPSGGTPAADITPPHITNVSGSASAAEAIIRWQTGEAADTDVEYGVTENYGQISRGIAGVFSTQHQLTIGGLIAGTRYFLRVSSSDAAGNTAYAGPFTVTTSAPSGDSDRDGLIDGFEQQLGTNPYQEDTDTDGFGDAKDPNPVRSDPAGTRGLTQDSDRDGLPDAIEKKLGTDPRRADTDGDGVSDRWDAFFKDPKQTYDSDGDSLSDEYEKRIGINAWRRDTDNDGTDDGAEIRAGMDPAVAAVGSRAAAISDQPGLLCAEYLRLSDRVRCRAKLTPEELARQEQVQYLPEECRAIPVMENRAACIQRYRDVHGCRNLVSAGSRIFCAARVLNYPSAVSLEITACQKITFKSEQAECVLAVRQRIYAMIIFRMAELGVRANELKLSGAPAEQISAFLIAQEQAVVNFSQAETKEHRRAAILGLRSSWQTFVKTVAPRLQSPDE